MTQKLYVGNLSFETTELNLRDLLSQAGDIATLNVITDQYSGKGKGFAFVEMATDTGTEEIIKRFNGHTLDNRSIIINATRVREVKTGSGSGSR